MQPFLLISSPALADTGFGRSVVLVWQYDADGAAGVVINKPTQESVLQYLPEWKEAIAPPRSVFAGGPVEEHTAIGISAEWDGSVQLSEGLALVDLDSPPKDQIEGSVRVFAGYSGWSEGQLNEELAQGAWLVAPFEESDLLAVHSERLWLDVVDRLGPEHQFLKNLPASQRAN